MHSSEFVEENGKMNRFLLRLMGTVALVFSLFVFGIVLEFSLALESGAGPASAFAQDAGGGVAANDTVQSDSASATSAAEDSAAAEQPAVIHANEPAAAEPGSGVASDAVKAGTPPATKHATPSAAKPARIAYTTPGDVPLPAAKFAGMRRTLVFDHFPNPVSASRDPEKPGLNFWKHNTVVMSETEDVTLEEAGSYIYYNDQWNLRVTLTPEEFAQYFACPNALLKAGQPYTWNDNWRTDERLYGGWACYYAIGVTAAGERVYGSGPIETTGFYYFGEDEWAVVADSSSAGWTGSAEFNDFTIDGTLTVVSGSVVVKGFDVLGGDVIFDMTSIASGVDGIAAHLMNADFFEVETYPYAVFKLTEPVALGRDGGVARGQLTMKGVTNPVDVTFTELFIWDDEGMTRRMEARGETTFDRTDFDITFGNVKFFPDAGEHAVADEVVFRFDLKLNKVLERESANNSR